MLHTSIIEARRNALQRTNVFLMSLTFLLCVFSTYLTRSGVIESLHSFGASPVAVPLFWSMVVWLAVTVMVTFMSERPTHRILSDFLSRQGMLVIAAWFLLALGMVVTLGTLWPVIAQLWTTKTMGLTADFYNRVCLPFMALLVLLFCYCPWMGWKGGIRNVKGFVAVTVVLVVSFGGFYAMGITEPLATLTAAAAVAAMAGIVMLFIFYPAMRVMRQSWGAYGVHLGLALMALGIAFSGPYKIEAEMVLAEGESAMVGDYSIKYTAMKEDSDDSDIRARATATLEVTKDGKLIGIMMPDRRIYRNFEQQQFAEVSTIPSLGDELYSTLLGFTEADKASFKVSVNPLVNWVWIGGTLMCLLGFLLLRRMPRPGEDK